MRRLLRSAVMVVLLAGAGALPAAAGDGTGARKSLEIGIKAYREGAVEASIEALSGALEEGLGSHDTAQALYYRGLAYRALGKPGQAIADLTGAIAEKNGLAPSQLADAADNRTAAYAEAGISSSESVVVGKPAKRLRTSARGPKPQSFLTTTSIDPIKSATSLWGAARIVPPTVPAGEPTAHAEAGISSSGSVVVGKPAKGSPASSVREPKSQSFLTTTSIDATAPANPPWNAATIAPPQAHAKEPTVFATEVLSSDSPSAAAARGIRLQVARVQTQSEAYALAVRLVSQHGAEFRSDMLRIERAVAENKGPVFLVRLGPFASADEAQQRCSALRRGGFDCVVQY